MDSVSIRINGDLYLAAKRSAKGEFRTIPAQIEFWAKVGRAALDNPDLPVDFVRDVLISKDQDQALAEPFVPEGSDE
ncbi:MAG: ParD-like family protein [Gammaproteobacteria bacterium]|nr:ParD-like family protein [Gammaproteobacteria bacterium]